MSTQLYALNEGWPFGDGPLRWPCHVEVRVQRQPSAWQIHMICDACPQSVFCLMPKYASRGFTWNLELLKSRVADHVLKCHPEAAT